MEHLFVKYHAFILFTVISSAKADHMPLITLTV